MKVLMPQVGMTMQEGEIVEWEVKDGDHVKKGDILFSFSTEKLVSDIEAPASGILKIIAQVGDIVECGKEVAEILAEEDA